MRIKQFEIWIADLNPQVGTETGKLRPVIVVQSNLLNNVLHLSTLICPITTNVNVDVEILRVHLNKGMAKLNYDCDIMIDQLRAIDNKRLVRKIGKIPSHLIDKMKENLTIILDLEY